LLATKSDHSVFGAVQAGTTEFLTKPVRDRDLLEAILLAIVQDRAHRDDERVVGERAYTVRRV
jgi:FixJ family two-component response regulator